MDCPVWRESTSSSGSLIGPLVQPLSGSIHWIRSEPWPDGNRTDQSGLIFKTMLVPTIASIHPIFSHLFPHLPLYFLSSIFPLVNFFLHILLFHFIYLFFLHLIFFFITRGHLSSSTTPLPTVVFSDADSHFLIRPYFLSFSLLSYPSSSTTISHHDHYLSIFIQWRLLLLWLPFHCTFILHMTSRSWINPTLLSLWLVFGLLDFVCGLEFGLNLISILFGPWLIGIWTAFWVGPILLIRFDLWFEIWAWYVVS